MQVSVRCTGKTQPKFVQRIKRIRGQVDVIECAISAGDVGDVLMLLETIREEINSLLAEILGQDTQLFSLPEQENTASPEELTGNLIDLVRVYLK